MEDDPEALHLSLIYKLLKYKDAKNFEKNSVNLSEITRENLFQVQEVKDLQGYEYLTTYLLLNLNEKLMKEVKSQSSQIARLENCLGVGWEGGVDFESYWWYEKVSRFAKIINSNAGKIESLQLEYLQTKQDISNIMESAKSISKLDSSTEMFVKEAIDALFMETNRNRNELDTIEKKCTDHKAALDLCSLSVCNIQEKLERLSERKSLGRDVENWKERVFNSGKDDLSKDLKLLCARIERLELGSTARPQSLKRDVNAESYWLYDKIAAFSKILNTNTEKLDDLELKYSNIKQDVDRITKTSNSNTKCDCSTESFLKDAVNTLFVEINQNKNNVDALASNHSDLKTEVNTTRTSISQISNNMDELTEKTTDQLNQMWRLVNVMNTKLVESNQHKKDVKHIDVQTDIDLTEQEMSLNGNCISSDESSIIIGMDDADPNVAELCKGVVNLVHENTIDDQPANNAEEGSTFQFSTSTEKDMDESLADNRSTIFDNPPIDKNLKLGGEQDHGTELSVMELNDKFTKQDAKIKDLCSSLSKFEEDLQSLRKDTLSVNIIQEKFKEIIPDEAVELFSMRAPDYDGNDVITDGLDGICHFAIQINDKVTEISNRILASEFKISQVNDDLLLTKKVCDKARKDDCCQINDSLRRLSEFELTITDLKRDIDRCKEIMSNDFILSNDEDNSIQNIGFAWEPPNDLSQNPMFGQQAHPPPVDTEKDPNHTTPTFAKSTGMPLKNRGFKLQIIPCTPEFLSIVNSIDTNLGPFDSITTQDELKDLYSRKLALIKDTNRMKHNPELDLED